jgi:hypothetical protein
MIQDRFKEFIERLLKQADIKQMLKQKKELEQEIRLPLLKKKDIQSDTNKG